jgi:hypothetical protein
VGGEVAPGAVCFGAEREAVPWADDGAVLDAGAFERSAHVRAGLGGDTRRAVAIAPGDDVLAGHLECAGLLADAARSVEDVPVAGRLGQGVLERALDRARVRLLPVGAGGLALIELLFGEAPATHDWIGEGAVPVAW